MKIDTNDMLNSILENLSKIDYIRPEEIPNIDLYMDQVTTFMDEHLSSAKRYEEDKVLTKTMINNYTKNHLLPPPVKKKYTREHVLMLIFIYYYKNILSIKDIETVLTPLKEKYFSGGRELDLVSVYDEVCRRGKEQIEPLKENIKETYEKAMEAFPDIPEGEDQEELRLFSFLCSLSLDVYLKKMIVEKILDQFSQAKKDT